MTKQEWLDMGYQEIEGGEFTTLYKRFEETGNMYVVQFNEAVTDQEIGMVFLSYPQVQALSEPDKWGI